MRKSLLRLAALAALTLALFMLPQDAGTRVAAQQGPPPERCEECNATCHQHLSQCEAVFGTTELRCYDQYNECVVHCYRHFCEQ